MFRAVVTSLTVATVLGVAYLVYDIAIDDGARPPGGDLRLAFLTAYVAPRTPWSAALGLFAAVPIAYHVLVVLHEIVKPLLT